MRDETLSAIRRSVSSIYTGDNRPTLAFHNYSHIKFVEGRAIQIGIRNNSNINILSAAALLHDLNYMVDRSSDVKDGEDFRRSLLSSLNVESGLIKFIENIIVSADISSEQYCLCPEACALSDADTLYKILPITPILFAKEYMAERNVSLRQLGEKILGDQLSKFDNGELFHDPLYKEKYSGWARTSLSLWSNVIDSLREDDIALLSELE